MNESTDASRILFEPLSEVWRKPRGRPRNSWVRLLLTTWQTPTLGFRKRERQLRTGSTGGCLRSIAQRTRSGACSYWILDIRPLLTAAYQARVISVPDPSYSHTCYLTSLLFPSHPMLDNDNSKEPLSNNSHSSVLGTLEKLAS